jgi:hypothetical protein
MSEQLVLIADMEEEQPSPRQHADQGADPSHLELHGVNVAANAEAGEYFIPELIRLVKC